MSATLLKLRRASFEMFRWLSDYGNSPFSSSHCLSWMSPIFRVGKLISACLGMGIRHRALFLNSTIKQRPLIARRPSPHRQFLYIRNKSAHDLSSLYATTSFGGKGCSWSSSFLRLLSDIFFLFTCRSWWLSSKFNILLTGPALFAGPVSKWLSIYIF